MITNSSDKVFIIVLNWNGYKDTLNCIKSLMKYKKQNHEIVVVDNNSEDNSVEKLRHDFPGLKILETGSNLGYAGGNNVGIKFALDHGADYLFILNNDCTIDSKCLDKIIEPFSDHRVGVVQPVIYYSDEKRKVWVKGFNINWKKRSLDKILFNTPLSKKDVYQVGWVTGAAMFIKREVVEKAGFIPDEYFMFSEDIEWSLKIRLAGYKLMVSKKAKVFHKVGSSFGRGSNLGLYYSTRNILFLLKKYAPFRTKMIIYARSIFSLIKLLFTSDKSSKFKRAGIVDFYLGRKGKLGRII